MGLLSCAPVAADARGDYERALKGWAEILARHVDAQGQSDFVALRDDPMELERFVAAIGAYGPESHPEDFASRSDVLAYHINAYNAHAMHGVIERGIPSDFSSFFKRASFFRFRSIVVAGRKTNLYEYENKVIRPLDEPRIHFALNCMVRDCPRLPQKPFVGADLEADLEAATREFFNSEKYVQIDADTRTVRVSAILDFYTKDFAASGKRADLGAYVDRYRDEPLPPGYRIRFLDYDWTVNRSR